MEDTIAAISTALGVGAISIVRVSGPEAIKIVDNIFDKNIKNAKSHTIHYGHIIDGKEIIDEVLVNIMLSPKTYTTEDTVEINCHGGISTTNRVLELLLTNGARLADPGEFTKRAFLNGRIDLTQAEGIMNLIESKTEAARTMSINQLNGNVSNLISSLRTKLSEIISNIEINIDYPEYEDIEVLTNDKIKPSIKEFQKELIQIIKDAENGKILNEGIKIGIIGKPNVGKSSLLNALLEEEKAIVTNIEGTTRDIVEGSFILNGVICHILDTAGIRKTTDLVEQLGVNKSLEIIEEADLILFVLNNNEKLTNEEKEILSKIKNKKNLIIINKIDLDNNLNIEEKNTIKISIKENIGLDVLKNRIIELFNLGEITTKDMTYLSNARSISLLKKVLRIINEIIENIENNTPIDIVEMDLKNCWTMLGEIIGKSYTDELIDEIFSRFCLGK